MSTLSLTLPGAAPLAAPLLAGFGLSLSLIVAIGAQNAFVLRQGLRREHVGAVVLICALLDVALMTVGVSGVAATLGRHRAALDALALAGAAFLAWYGVQAARRSLRPHAMTAATDRTAPQSLRPVLLQTLAITLFNPHVYLDTVLLVGAVGAQQPAPMRSVFLAGAGLASALWFAALGYGARLLAPLFARPAAWRVLDALVAVTMFVLAAMLLRMAAV
jgi:L-lysine exporter family protein LysE/ArgO